MNWTIISALVRKDIILFFSNRFFALITFLALFGYAAIYFLLPAEIDETLEIALFAPEIPAILSDQLGEDGLVIVEFRSEEMLQEAIALGNYNVGAALPADFTARLENGEQTTVDLYFTADFPEEFKDLYVALFQELGFMMSGRPLNINVNEEILGIDLAGQQIAYRDRMLPLFAVFILMMETMGLASLIASEISAGTLHALLVTPMRVEGLFMAKGITGVGLAFTQAGLLMAVTGGLNQQPLLILFLLLLGALLATGVGFLIASVTKDLMSVMGWGMLAILVLSLPAFTVLIPGTFTDWIQLIPSYHLVDPVYQVTNFSASWTDIGPNLAALAAFSLLFLALGVTVLRRKFQ